MKRIKEIIGNISKPVVTSMKNIWGRLTIDYTRPSYAFWDKIRRGRAHGFELSGLLAKPVTEILTSWVVGDGFSASLEEPDEYTDAKLGRFIRRYNSLFRSMVIDLFALGDQYIILNADGSISTASPDTVEVVYHPMDYRRMVAVHIRTALPRIEIIDSYYEDRREVRIKNLSKKALELDDGQVLQSGEFATMTYDNLIGRIPVVHFANDRGGNETNGRPMIDALYTWFAWYDDVLSKALAGVKRLSNPILVFFNLTDAEATEAANSVERGYDLDEDGYVTKGSAVDIDPETPVMFNEAGADVKFIGPNTGFTQDAQNMLQLLYLLYSEHLGLPDVVMGFEMSAARASAAEQLRTFYAKITGLRLGLEGVGPDEILGLMGYSGFLAVIDIWLHIQSLTDPLIKRGSVVIEWPELNEAQMQVIKTWADSMYDKGMIQAATYMQLSTLIENVNEELERARAEIEAGRGDAAGVERDEAEGLNDQAELFNPWVKD